MAAEDGYRCRSAYKLLQIDDKHRLFAPGQIVVDCGAAPGSWSQVAVHRVNALGTDSTKPRGRVIGVDLLPIQPLRGAHFLPYCDFTQESVQRTIRQLLDGQKANTVLSDMAPNASGVKPHNEEKIISLCFSVLIFSLQVLETGGNLLCKVWMGGSQERLQNALRSVFLDVQTVKPPSSRADSAEIFFLAKGFKKIEKS